MSSKETLNNLYNYILHFMLWSYSSFENNCYKLTCSVQLTLFLRNSTNLSTTPGVFITSSIGGLGSEINQRRHGHVWLVSCKLMMVTTGR